MKNMRGGNIFWLLEFIKISECECIFVAGFYHSINDRIILNQANKIN